MAANVKCSVDIRSDRFLVQSFALPDELAASLSSMDSSATQQIGDLVSLTALDC